MENETQNPIVAQNPVQEVQTVQPVTQVPSIQPKKRHIARNILMILGIAVLGAVGYIGYTNPELLSASITGGASQPSSPSDLYISTDYKSPAGESDSIDVKAGKDLTNLTSPLIITFVAPSNQIDILSVKTDGTPLNGVIPTTSNPPFNGEFTVTFNTFTAIPSVSKDTVLFKLFVNVKSGVSLGETITITSKPGIAYSSIREGTTNPPARALTFTDGKITVGTATSLCTNVTCGDHAACSQTTGECVCNKGYDPEYLCNACIADYTGFPDCKFDVLKNMLGIVLTFNNDTLATFSPAEHAKAYSSAYVMINSSAAAAVGKTVTVEGVAVPIPASTAPGTPTEVDRIKSITDNIKTPIGNIPGVIVAKVTTSTGVEIPGLLKLTASGTNTDLDGITTNSGDVIIVPALESTITLLPTSSYQTRVIGKNIDGTVLELNFNNIIWQPQPVNRLSDTALKGGLLEKGDKGGLVPLYAQIKKSDDTTIDSNKITVEVPAGPIIEYIHTIGSSPISKGGRISLSVKVSDIDQISDIKDIRTSIVRSAQTTYAGISNDATATWFTATPVIAEVATTGSGSQSSASSTTTAGGTPATPATPSTPSIPTAVENYRIYSMPVEIPQDANLADGPYNLILQITDVAGHMATAVLPITLSSISSGDLNGDGKVTMLDVIAAFQISNGANTNPTQSQLQAADLDKSGKVTMLDVINLFNKIK